MKKVIDKSDSRGHSLYDWLDSHHTFSFDEYYNPRRMNFGALRVLNDDRVAPGKSFGTHPHKNMEIISMIFPQCPFSSTPRKWCVREERAAGSMPI